MGVFDKDKQGGAARPGKPPPIVYNTQDDLPRAEGRPQRPVYDYNAATQKKQAAKPAVPETPLPILTTPVAVRKPAAPKTRRAATKQSTFEDDGLSAVFATRRTPAPPPMQPPQPPQPPRAATAASSAAPRAKGKAKPGQKKKQGTAARKKQKPKQRQKKAISLEEARILRRRRRVAAVTAGVVVAAAGLIFLFFTVFKVSEITFEGETPYTQEELLLAFGCGVGDNIFSFTTEQATSRMQAALPYLEGIDIERQLPGKITVHVTPAQETYYINSPTGWAILSSTLRVLRISPEMPGELAQITGLDAATAEPGQMFTAEDANAVETLQRLLAEAATQGLMPVTQVDVADTLNISFVYAGRVRIVIGTTNELADKLNWAKYLLTPENEQSIGEAERGRLDVSTRTTDGYIQGVWRAGEP